ncbi:type IV pilus biogenesis/stability protein PilW [bacterium]|nr:MAG: type IV pilus biogenesis/stability protein PilW [bacterium]
MSAALVAVAALGALLLAGCVTNNPEREVVPKDAARANLQLGIAYLQQGNLALAKEKLERAEKQDGRNAEVHTGLAFLYERLDRKKDAESHYASARRLAPDSADIANTYGVFLCRNGKADAAVREFEAAAKNPLYTTPWAALTNAGVCLRSAKQPEAAVRYLQQSIQIRPNYTEAVVELADLQLEQGSAEAAYGTANGFLGLGLSSPDVLLVALRAAQARGDSNTVSQLARRLRRDFPNSIQTRALPQLLNEKG